MASDKIKVKVQYIHRHPIEQQLKDNLAPALEPTSLTTQEDEVENIEYLDECPSEEYATPPRVIRSSAIDTLDEDDFYPNAVHCLIALYQLQYEQLAGKNAQQLRAMRIWDAISNDMKESYFDFGAEQVRCKFTKLRLQYFEISCKEHIEAFYFFSNMHDIYNDKRIAAILRGETKILPNSVRYDDEELYVATENSEGNEVPTTEYKQAQHNQAPMVALKEIPERDAITHKEHEFIDLVEKELHAMEQANNMPGSDSDVISRTLPPSATRTLQLSPMLIKKERSELVEEQGPATTAKRAKLSEPDQAARGGTASSVVRPEVVGEICSSKPQVDLRNVKIVPPPHSTTEPARLHKESEHYHLPKLESVIESCVLHQPMQETAASKVVNGQNNVAEMSLVAYNVAQQRRHEEKMEIMRRSLQLQERIAKQQQQLLEQLIKRL